MSAKLASEPRRNGETSLENVSDDDLENHPSHIYQQASHDTMNDSLASGKPPHLDHNLMRVSPSKPVWQLARTTHGRMAVRGELYSNESIFSFDKKSVYL
jgi:hypothetical protein